MAVGGEGLEVALLLYLCVRSSSLGLGGGRLLARTDPEASPSRPSASHPTPEGSLARSGESVVSRGEGSSPSRAQRLTGSPGLPRGWVDLAPTLSRSPGLPGRWLWGAVLGGGRLEEAD